jgi:hypothetical protein
MVLIFLTPLRSDPELTAVSVWMMSAPPIDGEDSDRIGIISAEWISGHAVWVGL